MIQIPSIILIPVFLGNLRGWEWLILFLLILLLFGGKKIPELMRGIGKGIHSFRQGMKEAREEMERPLDQDNNARAKDNSSDSVRAGKDRD